MDIAALNEGIKEAMLARAERLTLKAMGMAEDKVIRATPRASTRPCEACTASSAFAPAW